MGGWSGGSLVGGEGDKSKGKKGGGGLVQFYFSKINKNNASR